MVELGIVVCFLFCEEFFEVWVGMGIDLEVDDLAHTVIVQEGTVDLLMNRPFFY